MKDVFPYEEYKNAIVAESKVRATGVEATVLAVEGDATREGCIVVGVEFKGRFDEGLYENGTLTKDGACIGRIVAFADDDAGMVVVESRGGLIPAAGDTVTFVAADYFQPLRKFAAEQRKADRSLAEERRRLAGLEHDDPGYLETLMKITKLLETLRLIGQRRRAEIAALVNGAKIVCSTITACLYNGFMAGGFDVVLVDEASQVPLVVWPCLMNRAGKKKFVVAGDPMQLEPVGAKDADVNTQFWFNQNIYAYLGMTSFRGIEPFYEAGAMTLLNEQTRMRKGICDVVSKLFYNGLLEGDRKDEPLDFSGTSLPAGDVAVLDPSEQGEAFGFDRLPATRFRRNANLESASSVLRAVREVVSHNPKGRKLDILVLSPFRDQCRLYGRRLKVMPHGEDVTLRASTVHSCQGSEADLVFFDLVNPASSFISRTDAAHLWCVACSRAKQKLVIVGDKPAMRLGRYSSAILREVNLAEPAVVREPGSYRVAV